MYEEGYKGQITFFSNIFGIILTSTFTIVITTYFTNMKIKKDRKNSLLDSLYLEDHRIIYSTISFIDRITTTINKCDLNAKLLNHSHKKKIKKNIESLTNNSIDNINTLYTQYLSFILLNHGDKLKPDYRKLYGHVKDLVKYDNNVSYNNNKISVSEAMNMNYKLQCVHNDLKNLYQKLFSIDKQNKYHLLKK